MSKIKLNGSSSGSVALDAPASTTGGADVTLTLPVNDGDANGILATNGSGALSWVKPGGILQIKQLRKGDAASTSAVVTDNSFTSGGDLFSLVITPSSASSYIWVTGMLHLVHASAYCGHYWLTYNHSGISEKMIAGNSQTSRRRTGKMEMGSNASTDVPLAGSLNILFAPNTTNEITVKIRAATSHSSWPVYLNQTTAGTSDGDDGGGPLSTLTLTEIAGSISPSITDSTIYEGT